MLPTVAGFQLARQCTQGQATRLIGAILLEQSNEWATQRARYMTMETIGSVSDNPTVSLPAVAA